MKWIILIFMFMTMPACGQNNNSMETSEMTLDEMADSIAKSIKYYDYEPVYMMHVSCNASFIVLVNDYPLAYYFGPSIGGLSFHINKAILKSGIQEVTVRVFPRYADKDTQLERLDDSVTFALRVVETSWYDDGGLMEPKDIYFYSMEDKKKDKDISNMEEFRDTVTFEATVPYELTGWSKSRDLRKLNKDELYKRVLANYKRTHSYHENGEVENIYGEDIARRKETNQAAYLRKSDIINSKNKLVNSFKNAGPEDEMIPLENFEMQFFGNGRMVALRRTDGRNRGESALRCEYRNHLGRMSIDFYDQFLHIPEGSEELEIIR